MTKATKRSGAGRSKAGPKAPAQQQVSAAQLFQQAQIALRYDDYDSAKKALQRAVKLEPTNTALVDAYASLLAELGDPAAKEALLHAVNLAPTSGHEKYMYLAQLEEDPAAALEFSSRGLAVLQQHLDAAKAAAAAAAGAGPAAPAAKKEGEEEEEDDVTALSKMLCSALCTHAETVLQKAVAERDLAAAQQQQQQQLQEPPQLPLAAAAVGEVEGLCQRAAAVLATSPEPGQVMASLRSEQGQSEEALTLLRQSMALWFRPSEDDSDEEGEQEGEAMAMDEDTAQQPKAEVSYEFRFECAKLLLELEETTETAIEVLSSLVEEDDTNPDVWHLLALAYYSGHQYEEALETLTKGLDLLRKLRVPKNHEYWANYEDLGSAIKEAMGAAAAAAGAAGVKGC